jgi:7-cyano-7-deazaguanine reductase
MIDSTPRIATMTASEYEGLQEGVRELALPELETWTNQYADRDYNVRLEIPEFNCICPKTGLPDFATIEIDYVPDRLCVELKSLKQYITAFRNLGIFHEHAVNRILDDFVRAVMPRRAVIEGVFNARGGIRTSVRAEYQRGEAAAERRLTAS